MQEGVALVTSHRLTWLGHDAKVAAQAVCVQLRDILDVHLRRSLFAVQRLELMITIKQAGLRDLLCLHTRIFSKTCDLIFVCLRLSLSKWMGSFGVSSQFVGFTAGLTHVACVRHAAGNGNLYHYAELSCRRACLIISPLHRL